MNNIDWTILRKSIYNDLNELEKQKLNEWLADSEENVAYYNKFKTFHAKQGKDSSNSYVNYQRFLKKVESKKRRVLNTWISYAASIIIVLGVGSVLYFQMNRNENNTVKVSDSIIKAGSKKAVLYLDNNNVVDLEDNQLREIEINKGQNIQQDSNIISYEKLKHVAGEKLSYNTIKIPRGGEYVMLLNDGTKVWVNSETEIRFPVVFPANERRVYIKGEAYFDVVKDGRPFIVSAGDVNIKVIGTEFNVRAYADEKDIQTTLVEGKVNVNIKDDNLILKPGEQAVLTKASQEFKKEKVDVSKYTAWKEGRFVFDDERLEEILNKVERWYDVNVFYMEEDLKDIEFRGNIDRYDDFNILLEKIEKLDVVRFKIKGNTITVVKK